MFPRLIRAIVAAVFVAPLTAQAGMTMPAFSDIAKARLEVLSFFFILFLVTTLVCQWAWNSLGKDFLKMPRVGFGRALAMMAVCGLFIYVVLTMISGARELMTPGAWTRSGVAYALREPDKDPKPWLASARRASLERLRKMLWDYASRHDGNFPTSREQPDIPSPEWNSIDPGGMPLVYMPGSKPDAGKNVVAYEPGSFGRKRFVLFSDGAIAEMDEQDLSQQVQNQVEEFAATRMKQVGNE